MYYDKDVKNVIRNINSETNLCPQGMDGNHRSGLPRRSFSEDGSIDDRLGKSASVCGEKFLK